MPFLVNSQMMHSFELQFTNEAGSLVYRRFGKGPAYSITDDQRERFVLQFVRGCRIMIVIGTFLMGGPLVAAVYYLDAMGKEPGSPFSVAVLIASILPSVAAVSWMSFRLAAAPERKLRRDLPIAPGLNREQRRSRLLSMLDYHHLAVLPVMGLGLVWKLSRDLDTLHGLGRLVWLIPVGLAALASAQAYRKFKFEREVAAR